MRNAYKTERRWHYVEISLNGKITLILSHDESGREEL
jgi:hypothetical protein